VVVLGPNEAGKSTVFHLLTSLLYGFYPASRDNNPYAPWDGTDLGGAMTVKLDAGGCVEVERRLLSQPSARVTVAGEVEELRNRTLPWVEHVPRAVFLQVFALTLEELAGLEEETWGRIQDRIVGAMGAADLLPARQVINELEQAAGELWRPNRRGNQRIRDIQQAVLGLRERRRSSGDRDRTLRHMVAELERVRAELQEARQDRNVARLAVERVQSLIPIRSQLLRIAGLRDDAGPSEALAELPGDPLAELEARRRRVRDVATRLRDVGTERAEPEAALAALDADVRRILERSGDISALVARAAALRGDRARRAALDQEIRDLQRRLEAQAAHLLTTGWTGDAEAAVAELPLAGVREGVRRFRSASEELRVLEAAGRQAPPAPAAPKPPLSLSGSLAVAVPGLVLLVYGAVVGEPLPMAVGSAALALGVGLVVLWGLSRRGARGSGATGPALSARTAAARAALEATRTGVGASLSSVPVSPGLLDDPDDALVLGLERLQEILRDRRDRAAAARDLAEAMAATDGEARALAGDLSLDGGHDADTAAHLLERALRRAEALGQTAVAAERELRRLDREEERLAEEDRESAEALRDLEDALTQAGQGDPERGARSIRERIQARDRADQLEDELERAHPDLEEIRARIREAEQAGDSWTVDEDDLARRKAQVEELTERVEKLATRAEALDRDIAHLQQGETVDAVDGEIASLQQEESVLLRERDRLWVLAQVLREADRRFREEHQPDLLRRAGSHLAALTAGRYDRIVVDEAAGSQRFQLSGPALARLVPLAPPISTGTLEQAYLALRLAIVDHLDQGLEKLPLFVDEILVNWDDRRRRRGVELLGALSRTRQIFVFTCHPTIAEALQATGGRVLELGDGGPR
jgi:uncharacterized protein YhaN